MSVLIAALLVTTTAACSPKGGEAAAVQESMQSSAQVADERLSVFELGSKFLDQNGVDVSLQDVSGETSVVAFIYTNCTATCPLIVGALKRIESALSDQELSKVRFILVSIDPDRDTPGRLADWARDTRLDLNRWTLLAGDDATIRELAVSLDARYQTLANGEIAHTNGFSVIDEQGRVVHHQPGFSDVSDALKAIQTRR